MSGAILSGPKPARNSPSKIYGDQYIIFETTIGSCGIAWTRAQGVAAVTLFQLPEASPEATRRRISRYGAQSSDSPPPEIRALISRVCAHLNGELSDFQDVELDLRNQPAFALRVYEAARRIPPGQTRTYGDLARELGQPNAARAVGQALGNNPIPLIVPCHRVVAAGGRGGGFSAHGGLKTKARLLDIERVTNGLF